nr:MAG TPA: hypothetical protein [Caudoviricetes sp.]
MKPTWGIRKLNEYSVDKNTAIIITDSEKDNYYWADIPDGSLLVNDKTGNLSIKLTGESDWVPMGIRKDGTEKLVKDAVINVEYYTIVKFELEHNRFYYHDREEITRIGKIINGKAQFKVGSGLYLPSTNQLEVLINDSVHRNTIDGGLEEINMKYFQIDADDIRLGSTVTVRYINYERLSELYPFIYTQEQVPWFFEDKDLWINPSNNIDVNGLTITPLSYYVKYLDNNEAEVIVFTTKNSRLIASRKMNEYVNKITDKNVNRFKVTRENNNFYINIFSTYPGYKTSFAKVLIKGLISDEDKLTLDVDLTYPNSGMAKISAKTQLGNIITFKRNNRKIYSAQNIGIGVQHTLAREEHDYEVIVSVKNPTNGLTKEKILTIKKKMIRLTANVSHVTTPSGTTITIETIPESKIKVVSADEHGVDGTAIIPETAVDADGQYTGTIPLTNSEAHYKIIVTNEKADNTVEENIEVLLHNPRTPLLVNRVDAYDGLDDSLKGRSGISVQAESGSTIVIKDQANNIIFTHTPSNLSTEDTQYNVPLFYAPETKTFIVEANKTNKVPESKTITIQGYEKIDAPLRFQVKDLEYSLSSSLDIARTVNTNFIIEAGSTVTVYDAQNNIINNSNNEQHSYYNSSIDSFTQYNNPNYTLTERNSDQTFRFVCSHPLYKDQEVTKVLEGRHLPEHTIELKDAFVINPYADMYNSSAYQVLALKVKHNKEDLGYESLLNDFTFEYNGKTINSINDLVLDNNIFFGGKESYKYFYDTDDLSNVETLMPNNKLNEYINNSYCINLPGETTLNLLVFKVDNFDDVLHDRIINIKINGKATNDITIPTTILHWSNIEEKIKLDHSIENIFEKEQKKIVDKLDKNSSFNLINKPINNSFSVNNNIKYIHPNLVKHISVYFTKDCHEERKNKIINKMFELGYFSNEKYFSSSNNNYDVKYSWNKIFDEFYKYLNFTTKIILFPSQMSYLYTAAMISDRYLSTGPGYIRPYMYLKCNINNDNIIRVKGNNLSFITDFYKSIEDLGITKFNTTKFPIEYISSYGLSFCFYEEKVPSFFLGDYYNYAVDGYIWMGNVKEFEENSLAFTQDCILIDYSKIKKLNNFSFSNLFIDAQGPSIKNIGNNDDITIILNDEECTDNRKYMLSDLDENMDYSKYDKLYPFPVNRNSSDEYNLIIKAGNNHLLIQDLLFHRISAKSLTIEAASITFIDEDGDKISYNSIPSKPKLLGMNSNFNVIKDKYNIPANINVNRWINFFGHFEGTKLKIIDLSKFTNYYFKCYEFHNSDNLLKIIFPDHYLARSYKGTENYYQALSTCRAKEIENLDFILCSTNTLGADVFYNTTKLNTPININYIKNFGYSCFSSSNASDFIYRKRTITNDYLGKEIILNPGYLESQENNLPFTVTLDDTPFFQSNMSQESFDRMKDSISIIKHYSFFEAKNIKNVILNNSNLKFFEVGFHNVSLEKFIINSDSVKYIVLEDSFLNNQKLHENSNNYKINAENAKVFIFQNKGAYSTLHTINMPNLEYSYVAKLEKRKEFGIGYWLDQKPGIMYKHIDDFGGTTNGINISYFNDLDSVTNANKEELEIIAKNIITNIFSDIINKDDIKVKRMVINLDYTQQYSEVGVYGVYRSANSLGDMFKNKEYIQQYRWPNLEEIIIKNNYTSEQEYNILGVKIKYVKA